MSDVTTPDDGGPALICVNCLYARDFERALGEFAKCVHPKRRLTKDDLVTGVRYAARERESGNCGPAGKHFEPKPPRVSWWRRLIGERA